jgi:SNF2 family DNA or RNA helicase
MIVSQFNNIILSDADKTLSRSCVERIVLDKVDDVDVCVHPALATALHPHQAEGIQFMYDSIVERVSMLESSAGTGCILAHSMGLGKTLQCIALIHTLLTNTHLAKHFKHILVLCPKNALGAWACEFEKWQRLGTERDSDGFKEVRVSERIVCGSTSDVWYAGAVI